MWSAAGAWSNTTTYSASNQPVVTIDGSGNWSGWIYVKHNDALGAAPNLRAAKVGTTSTNLTSAPLSFLVMTMTTGGNGGWLIRSSSPAVNKPIAAFAGGKVVGAYRTEDNGIAEGYGYGAGGFKVAVPAGVVDSVVTYNDDGSRDQSFPGPWVITAGGETDAASSGQIGHGSAVVSPGIVAGGSSRQFAIKISGESSYTLSDARIMFPAGWLWSRSTADIALTGGGTPTASVAGDTIVIGTMSVASADSIVVTVQNVIPPDTTARFSFDVRTGTGPASVFPLAIQPGLLVYGTPQPIAAVRANDANGVPLLLNHLVTVRGVVTVANEFGGLSYIQDNSAGIGVFGSAFSTVVHPGDEVLVTGMMSPFNGLSELASPLLLSTLSTGNSLVPAVATCAQVAGDGAGGFEQFEGMLVRINGVTLTDTMNNPIALWTVTGSGTNYRLHDGAGALDVRVDNNVNFANTVAPGGAFDVVGVVSQFKPAAPFIGGYQLMPRSSADIASSGPVLLTFPIETDIRPTGLTVTWQTVHPGTTRLLYGRTPGLELGLAGDDTLQTMHAVTLEGLQSAEVYYIKAFSSAAGDTSAASVLIASTASPAASTGAIAVYFNHSVNTSLARPAPALGNQDLTSLVIARINSARRSIDGALYSLSSVPGDAIAAALVNARKLRGVDVRVICEADNRYTNAFTTLAANGIPLIDDSFDPVNAGAGLMHNKFFVFDARGGAPESVRVWTGSWNPTLPGTNDDYQNSIEIQDAALAGAYTIEFEEMWGSLTDVPNPSLARFGARKRDNTPHRFAIGGRSVECYFSPSDRTTSHLIATINAAGHTLGVATMTLTRSDIASALIAQRFAGKTTRIILDNGSDSGSQFSFLQAQGMDVRLKTGGGSGNGIFHHKYMVVDGENPAWGGTVLTGSHNWSSAAENANNENTLIIHDAPVANQYLQEFAARYYQFGGADSITGTARTDGGGLPVSYVLDQNYPNPFNPATVIEYTVPAAGHVDLRVYDLLGREIAVPVDGRREPGRYRIVVDGRMLSSGVYFYRLRAGSFSFVKRMILVK
jgi:phosphatidylserine/phosphatidylglycerophosphate/cardiolipin synthase-like enzyme